MLRILSTNDPTSENVVARLIDRVSDERAVEPCVREILAAVRKKGDEALLAFTKEFDGVTLSPDELKVTEEEIGKATKTIEPTVKVAIEAAKARIEAFHRHEIRESWQVQQEDGTTFGQLVRPLETVGIYVPGGEAPYPSTVLMNAVPAVSAGVPRLILVTPPGRDGRVDRTVLFAAATCGIAEIYRVGGAQAIAALAYGTATIPKVDKIVGPGSAYVNVAKRLVFGDVAIDSLAGPSEIVVLAEEEANPAAIAADLLSQAEHDSLATAFLVTPSRSLAEAVNGQIDRQIADLSRKAVIAASLEGRGAILIVNDLEEGIALVNRIAPEHLEVMVNDSQSLLPQLRNAGMILLGEDTAVAICDYGAGPNHVLPTGGTARFASPLGVVDFVKRTNFLHVTKEGLEAIADQVETLARIEGFTAHAAAVKVRRGDNDG
jgi:histidinol dehydrogenase